MTSEELSLKLREKTCEMAIQTLDFIKWKYEEKIDDAGTHKYIKALQMGINALEKQMPKKPTLRDKYDFYCPCCNEYLEIQEEDISIYSMTPPKYCLHCGQALDWGDTE
jgi:hypothetical protein